MSILNRAISWVMKMLAGGTMSAVLLASGSTARADSTCNILLSNVRTTLTNCSECFVTHHTTNFWDSVSHVHFGGYTDAILDIVNGHIVGSGTRLHSDQLTASGQPFDIHQGEAISYDIDPSGKLTMDGIYGPYDPVCYFDQFMVVSGSTAIEVFVFQQQFPL
jgi:hypothetical protein